MSGRHRKPTASTKKVAKKTFTAAGSRRADHAGSGGHRADCPVNAVPVKAQYIARAGAFSVRVRRRSRCGEHAGGGVRRDDRLLCFSVRRLALLVRRLALLVRRLALLVRRRRLRVRHQNPQKVRHQRVRRRQKIRRPQSLAPRHNRRNRVVRTPARHRRAAEAPHRLWRRLPKPRCLLRSPQRHPPSRRPPRRPLSNQPPRYRPTYRSRRRAPRRRCHRRVPERRRPRKHRLLPRPRLHRMRRIMTRIRHGISRSATRRIVPGRRLRHRRTGSRGWSSRPPRTPRRPLNRAPRQTQPWSRWPAPIRPMHRRSERFPSRSVLR